MRVRIGWGVAASAAVHFVLLAGLVWSMRPQFHAPAATPVEVRLIPRRLVERTADRPAPLVRPRAPRSTAEPAPDTPSLGIPPAPAEAPAAAAPIAPAAPPAPAPVPAYRGLGGCSDDPDRPAWQRPCFSAETLTAEAPHLRMTDPREGEWAAELARRKRRPRPSSASARPGSRWRTWASPASSRNGRAPSVWSLRAQPPPPCAALRGRIA